MGKCKLGVQEIEYVGHLVTSKGIQPTKLLVDTTQNLPSPKNREELVKFLGMAEFYNKFIPKFAERSLTLRSLLKKNPEFVWSNQCEKEFLDIKSSLKNASDLGSFDVTDDVVVMTDASSRGLSVLLQRSGGWKAKEEEKKLKSKTVYDLRKAVKETKVKIGDWVTIKSPRKGVKSSKFGMPCQWRFGRRIVLLWCLLQIGAMGSGTAFAPDFITYCVFKFLTGMAISGFIINDISLGLEWTPTKYRPIVSLITGCSATLGQLFLAGAAYSIREWHWLQIAVSLPCICFFLWIWWVPESVRWLAMNNKPEGALRNLKRLAKLNRKAVVNDITLENLKSEIQKEMLGTSSSKATPFDLFRTPAMRRITCCLTLVWFSSSFAFFALAMDLQRFSVDIYLVQVIFGVVELSLRGFGFISMSYLGRRFTQAGTLILAGLLVLSSLAVPKEMAMVQISLTALGKGLLGTSIVCAYLYTAELYPTTLRQTGVGFTNMMMRLGAVIAPLVLMVKDYVSILPGVIFGVVPILFGLSVFLLPETKNTCLPDSVAQVEKRPRTKLIPSKNGNDRNLKKTKF
ncbi:solute carrier family 22 member 6-A-like [Lissotriton helveticus]